MISWPIYYRKEFSSKRSFFFATRELLVTPKYLFSISNLEIVNRRNSNQIDDGISSRQSTYYKYQYNPLEVI